MHKKMFVNMCNSKIKKKFVLCIPLMFKYIEFQNACRLKSYKNNYRALVILNNMLSLSLINHRRRRFNTLDSINSCKINDCLG